MTRWRLSLLRRLIRGSSPFPKITHRMGHSSFLDNGVADRLASSALVPAVWRSKGPLLQWYCRSKATQSAMLDNSGVPRLPMMTPPAVYYPSPVASPLIVQEGSRSRIEMSNTVVTLVSAMMIGAEQLSTIAQSSPVAGLARVVRRSPEVVEVATKVQSLQPLAQPQTTSPLGTVGTTSGIVVLTEPTVTQQVTSAVVRDDSVSRVAQVNAVVTGDSGTTISAGQTGTISSVSTSPVVSIASTAEEPKMIGEIVTEVECPPATPSPNYSPDSFDHL